LRSNQITKKIGGARRDRTADLLRARQALSQLSYGPVTCLFSVWLRWLFAHLVMYQFVHSRRSLTSRLVRRKKSCVTTSFVAAENSITVLINPNCAPFCTDQGKFDRRLLTINKGGFNAEMCKMVGLGRFELPTSPLSGVRSNQLSYRPAGCCFKKSDNL
jgi:hypothetical protein